MNSTNRIKFLYSYGGTILPRRIDGRLCYVGGFTRVLAVDRSITFTELMVKFGELCECSMSLRCKLPTEDLDLLVSVTCGEDLVAVIDEYDRASSSSSINDVKIRAILVPIKSSLKKSSSVPSFNCSKSKSYPPTLAGSNLFKHPRVESFSNPVVVQKNARKALSYSNLSELDINHSYLVRHGSYWQLNNYIFKEHK